MNAINFIKQHGIEKAREVVEGAPDGSTHIRDSYGYVAYLKDGVMKEWYHNNTWLMTLVWQPDYLLSDLKRLVDSVDLIGKYHSIDHAKNHHNNMREALNQYQYENKDIDDLSNELKQAIADYESIYSIPESVRQAILNLEMHL